ncbi:hypothetical protein EOD29_22915 [Mesorhizobium sp. M1A.T.Ca.IN.004.03.1.1]|uniref:hypothetical protein n=1 Tax=Mesorhizobium sp. M1A.T.Ca.IN.004.03.1.1 TaxID=2496795 RepID=UPI000FCA5CDB|nr:hypothetical protein [Mesorhizobium sp. M1A.T.Ca.IN.004.03.1.1]RUV41410.1 hypothetical protein EOD29_22915 [Mesorhizobium sp. M1A.T.Ca.IN.004.03.1.1]
MRYAVLLLVLVTTGASAQDKPIDPVDFLVDWKSEIGQQFRIHDVTIYGATQEYAVAILDGQYITVHEPWQDMNDMRFILRYCATPLPSDACKMTITATVAKDFIGKLQLVDVDFEIPN